MNHSHQSSDLLLDEYLPELPRSSPKPGKSRWNLAIPGGQPLEVESLQAGDLLVLDADTGMRSTPELLRRAAEHGGRMGSAAKFALRDGSPGIRLRAEFPLPPDGGAGDRIRQNLDALREAAQWLREPASVESCGEERACPTAPDGLAELLQETGWSVHARAGTEVLVDLEAGRNLCQAQVECLGEATLFRATLLRREAVPECVSQALSLYLLLANGALRVAKGFLRREEEQLLAGFQVRFETAPSPAEAVHALAALSAASRYCAKEMEVLGNGTLAGFYLAARSSFALR